MPPGEPSAEERLYHARSRDLFRAGEAETDETLRLALFAQSERIGMKALALQLERKRAELALVAAGWQRVRGIENGKILEA